MGPVVKPGRSGDPHEPCWTLGYLDRADVEARRVLNETEHAYVVDRMAELAEEENPACPKHGLSVDKVEDFFELREKVGALGKKNVRVFFFLNGKRRAIVVLGVFKKENEGQTPPATKRLMGFRKRMILEGIYRLAPLRASEG